MTRRNKIFNIFRMHFKCKPMQKLMLLHFVVFLTIAVANLLFYMEYQIEKAKIYENQSERITIETKQHSQDKPVLHSFSSDNYNNARRTYSVLDLMPKKSLSSFEPIDDRIILQLNHVPKSYRHALETNQEIKMKVIYFHGTKRNFHMDEGQSYFLNEQCAVNRCLVTYDRKKGRTADALVFPNPSLPFRPPWPRSSYDQIWAVNILESAATHFVGSMSRYKNHFNWTMTYRRDSTITTPYFKFQYFDEPLHKEINFAFGKTKKVAWMVSNCRSVSGRLKYGRELAKYISVDIYGACGTKSCRRGNQQKCHDMIKKEYKFYLAFENAKCLSYATEKFSQNALGNNAVPVVLGVSRAEMKEIAPPGSYIHVEDFGTPKELAEYLHKIDQDDTLFNQFFRWQNYGKLINTKVWCRMCSMLHEKDLQHIQQVDIEDWWRKTGTCIGSANWGY